jgi:succinoglycan biosynthesis protein ExoM
VIAARQQSQSTSASVNGTSIGVCISTYRRVERLASLLEDLSRQSLPLAEVIVVDNDAAGTARTIVEQHRKRVNAYPILYDIQPERSISLTRNRTVELSTAQLLAFIDDDERAPATWLSQLMTAMQHYSADAVLGPVLPVVPETAPMWIRRGRFYDFPRFGTGEVVPLNRMRFGNILLNGARLRQEPVPFDPAFGLGAGEDSDLLIRLARKGAKIIWCDEAVVMEPVVLARLSLRWLLQRALGGGQTFARMMMSGRYGPVGFTDRLEFIFRPLAQLVIASLLTILSLPFGRHHAAAWLVKASANLGKLSAFWTWRYQEYA